MIKTLIFLFSLLLSGIYSVAQNTQEKIIYIIDFIPVIDDPEEGNEISNSDISYINVIKNKDSLNLLGYGKFDGAIFIFTNQYRDRPDDVKQIPSSKQMERKGGVWYFRGVPYSGKFIDYYYNGRKQEEGVFQNGRVEGRRTMYHQNGQMAVERSYADGIENGLEQEYYEDGSLKQKGIFVNGKEEGIWEMYFPNGQVKQRSTFKNGNMEGETTVYYSTGKILAVEMTKNGKTTADKKIEKIEQILSKGHSSNRGGDYKKAIKYYTKAIEFDSTYAEAYFARGTSRLNDFQFDDAILDFNNALKYEPYFDRTLANRAFARIRKYQFGNSRKLSEADGVTIIASKDNPEIPENELAIICNDLKQAIFLGDRSKMIMEAFNEFCEPNVH